jgi:anti-sigma factor RsiW
MTPRDVTCRELVEFLMAYLDGDLPEDERRAFDAHLELCEACVEYLRAYEKTLRLEREAFQDACAPPADDIPEELVSAILAARRRPS